ncbi:MAG: EF-hand domain-containing protein [Proteobacteria bacterium]|nr:EF-hand domain-containing protein [Pseudomonadota bacterium]
MSGADKITEQQMAEFKDTFATIDKDGDGLVTVGDLTVFLRSFGEAPSEDDVRDMIGVADTEGRGMIDLSAFITLMTQQVGHLEQQGGQIDLLSEVKNSFAMLDKDGDGYVTAVELRRMMDIMGEKISDDEIDEMIRAADTSGDGRVSYDEFVAMLLK